VIESDGVDVPLRVIEARRESLAESVGERVALADWLRVKEAVAVVLSRTEADREKLAVSEGDGGALRERLPLAVVEALTDGTEREREGVALTLLDNDALSVAERDSDEERVDETATEADREAERVGEALVLGERLKLRVELSLPLKLRLALVLGLAVTLALGSQAQQAAGRVALQLASTTAPPADEPSSARHAPAPVGAGARHHDAFVDWK
jgi:hypothetical protein